MTTYVALLRGINLGARRIKMDALRALFESLGFEEVSTILASGNVVFSSTRQSLPQLHDMIAAAMKKEFGFDVTMQIRKLSDIRELMANSPFAALTPNKHTHWFVTFLDAPAPTLPPFPDKSATHVGARDNMMFYMFDTTAASSTDFMSYLDKHLGKRVTTRNWNTIVKIVNK